MKKSAIIHGESRRAARAAVATDYGVMVLPKLFLMDTIGRFCLSFIAVRIVVVSSKLRPKGYFKRFQAPVATIRSSITLKSTRHRWLPVISRTRQSHWLRALKKRIKTYLLMILAGQNNLIDKLSYRSPQPLASRIVARSHLTATGLEGMKTYLAHHLAIAGVEHNLFDQTAQTAIHQGSGGLFRKANHLARGALIAASVKQKSIVMAEHVQLAATEVF